MQGQCTLLCNGSHKGYTNNTIIIIIIHCVAGSGQEYILLWSIVFVDAIRSRVHLCNIKV